MPAISHPVRVLQHLGPSFPHCYCYMATTPFQADWQNAANTQKVVRARQAVENREEEGCVYTIPPSDLIGKLLELKYIRLTRAHPYHRLSL